METKETKTVKAESVTRLNFTPLDVGDGNVRIQQAIRETIEEQGPRKAVFDVLCSLTALAGALGAKGGPLVLCFSAHDGSDEQTLTIEGNFIGVAPDDELAAKLLDAPENTQETQLKALVGALKMYAALAD